MKLSQSVSWTSILTGMQPKHSSPWATHPVHPRYGNFPKYAPSCITPSRGSYITMSICVRTILLRNFLKAVYPPSFVLLINAPSLLFSYDGLGNDSYHFDFSVIQVFTMCTNIHTLFATELDSFSELLPLFPFSNIATLAFSEVLGERTLTPFPMLRNLFIYHSGVCFTDTSSPIVPPHLENLRSYSKSLFYLGTSRRIMWTIRA